MNKKFLGIIGAGYIAEKHLEVINKIKNLEVVAITSRTNTKAKKLAKKFSINIVSKDLDDLIKKNYIDAVLILVPPEEMFSTISRVIKYKIPFFTEKPPSLNFLELKKLCQKVKKNNITNMVGYNRRYYSTFNKGLEIINNKGKLLGFLIEGHERFWIIPINNFSSEIKENWIFANSRHTIDLLRFFGGEIKTSFSLSKSINEINGDQFTASIEFKSGTLGTYISNWLSPGGWSVKLYGEGVSVIFSPLEKGTWTNSDFQTFDILPDEIDINYKPGFFAQANSFINLILNNALNYPAQNLEGAYKTMILAEKMKS